MVRLLRSTEGNQTDPGRFRTTASIPMCLKRGTVHSAVTDLRAPINVSAEKWFSGVYAARGDFTHTLSQMESVYDIPKE